MPWSSPSTRSRPPASRSHADGRIRRNSAIACSASRGVKVSCVAERCSGTRVEQVDRHFARVERGELEREVDALFERLAHPEDAAATQLHARVARELRGCDTVVVRVRRADRGEPLAARLEVVVVAAHAGVGEAARLPGGEQSERARDLEPGLALDPIDRVDHPAQQPLLGTPHRDDDAELRRAGRPCRAAAARISSRSRNAYTSTPVRNRTDCEQNAQSSGHAPDLALMRLSSSTAGPHHASRTLCASAISDGSSSSVRSRDGERLVAGEPAALVEERTLGSGERHKAADLTCVRSPRPGRARPARRCRRRRSCADEHDRPTDDRDRREQEPFDRVLEMVHRRRRGGSAASEHRRRARDPGIAPRSRAGATSRARLGRSARDRRARPRPGRRPREPRRATPRPGSGRVRRPARRPPRPALRQRARRVGSQPRSTSTALPSSSRSGVSTSSPTSSPRT